MATVPTATTCFVGSSKPMRARTVGDGVFPDWELMVPFYQKQFSFPLVYMVKVFLEILVPGRTMEELLCVSFKTELGSRFR